MYSFYYDFIDKYIDRCNYQYITTDTDSAYIALTDNFKNLIKPELRCEYELNKYKWFLRNNTIENINYDRSLQDYLKLNLMVWAQLHYVQSILCMER